MIGALDVIVFRYANSFIGVHPALDFVVLLCATYLPFLIPVVFLISLGALIHRKTHGFAKPLSHVVSDIYAFLFSLGAAGVAYSVVVVIQEYVARPRPYITLGTPHLFSVDAASFPSSHATILFALVGAACGLHHRVSFLLGVVATIASVARVVAGVHYPLDIIAGALIGLVLGRIISLVTLYAVRKKKEMGA